MVRRISVQRSVYNSMKRRSFLSATALGAAGFAMLASPALADNWTDHQAIVGNISIDTTVPNTTNITQHTHFTKVQGDGDINAGWTVNVAQPSTTSKYVLYDIEGDPTDIQGSLNANGEIYIFDQNGVIFGKDSRVDVGSLVATTGHITDADLLDNDGRLTIVDATAGAIEMNGSISVADAGLAAFVAPSVKNSGIISAKLGKVALASGEKVTLDLYGDKLVEIAVNDQISDAIIDNAGTINAEGGTVVLQASAAKDIVNNTINMSGVINASSASVKGGKIVLGGGTVKVSGKMDASGKTGGGKIDVKGKNIQVADTAVLQSDAHDTGNGGNIDVIAQDHTDFRGTILARGGANGGNGGNAEVSGYKVLGYQGYADLSAAKGTMGTLLLDPEFAVIHSGLLHNPLGLGVVISAQALANSMRNSAVTLQADEFIDVGTKQGGYNLSTGNAVLDFIVNTGLNALPDGDIDLSTFNVWENQLVGYIFGFPIYLPVNVTGATNGGLTLQSDTINFNRDLTMGNGNLAIDANTVNLDSKIFASNGTTLLGDDRLSSNAGTVNVLSNDGSIQQGIYLADDAGGATVTVGPGTYQEQITINKNLALVGAGRNDTILQSPVTLANSYTQDGRNNFAIIHVHDASDVDISGFQIDGSTNSGNVYNDSNRFIGVAYHNAGGDFTDNWVRNITTAGNSSRSGFAFLGSAKNTASVLNISGNRFDDFQKYGIALADSRLTATVTDNVIVGDKDNQTNKQTGIYATSSAKVTVGGADSADGNTIRKVDYGVEIVGAANGLYQNNTLKDVENGFAVTNSKNTQLLDNKIDGNSVTGVSIVNSDGSSVVGGTIDTFDNGVVVVNSDDVTIDGVTFKNIADTSISVTDSDNATVQKNIINGGKTGVKFVNVTNSVIGGTDDSFANRIRDIANGWGNSGINIAGGSNLTVSHNNLRDVGGQGIYAEGSWGMPETTLVISDNIIRDTFHNGIYVKHWNGADITGNRVNGTTDGHGIQLELTKNTDVVSNIVRNVNKSGINLEYGNKDILIEDNTINGAKDGINLSYTGGDKNEGIDILSNTISNTVHAGIRMLRAIDVTISGNTLKDLGHQGIRGQFIDGLTITRNDIKDLGLTGMFIEDARDLLIRNNDISNSAGGNGLQLVRIARLDVINNRISDVGLDGMNINLVRDAEIRRNEVKNAGNDGIYLRNMTHGLTVRNNTVTGSAGDGIELVKVQDADIVNNTVRGSGGHGVAVEQSTGIDLRRNTIRNSAGSGIYFNKANNDILVRNNTINGALYGIELASVGSDYTSGIDIVRNTIRDVVRAGVKIFKAADVEISRNTLTDLGHQGIRAQHVNGFTITENTIRDLGLTGMFIEDARNLLIDSNVIRNSSGGNGLQLVRIHNLDILNNRIADVRLDGINLNVSKNIVIENNRIRDAGRDGMDLRNGNTVLVQDNVVRNSGDDGISLGGNDLATLIDNRIVGSAVNGVHSYGNKSGTIVLAGNTLTNNDVGALFESGLIDLTGDTNVINGGRVGLQFDPDEPLAPGKVLALLNDTIGTTEFNGQTDFYVELVNGALFNPGTPTVIDARFARFDGVSASDNAGFVLDPSEYNAINDMLWHYPFDNTLGLFFFGNLPVSAFSISQEDQMQYFSPVDLQISGLNLTINGLPRIEGGPQTFSNIGTFAVSTPADLNNISTAAGGDTPTPAELNEMETQAGAAEASCWGDAAAMAQSGQIVNVSYGSSLEDTLNGAVGCSSSL